MVINRIITSLAVVATFTVGAVTSLPAATASNDDNDNNVVSRAQLFRDGSVSCNGADDTSRGGGRVIVLPGEGEVHFTLKLRNASPNDSYVLAVSEEPNCANAQFFPAETTDGDGDATFYGTYTTDPGDDKNLLFNLVTTSPDVPRNREIATRNTNIDVPAPTP